MRIAKLKQKVLAGTLDAQERADFAHILAFNTTDSSCIVKAAEDEPIFTLRAHDRLACGSVEEWANRAQLSQMHGDKVGDARQCAEEMRGYADRKDPD